MTHRGGCPFCRRGLGGPPYAVMVRCPVCGMLVANRSCRRIPGARRPASDAGIGLLLALLVAAGTYAAIRGDRYFPDPAREEERRAPAGPPRIASQAPASWSQPDDRAGGSTEAPGRVRRWLPVVSRETLAAPPSEPAPDAAGWASEPGMRPLPSAPASGCEVQVIATGPQVVIEAPADAPEESLRLLARQKAEEVKWRYGVPRVRVSGYRQGDRYQVVVAPVED